MAVESNGLTQDAAGAKSEAAAELDAALETLPEAERQVIILHFWQGRSHRELGAELGISPEAAQKRVSRAVERLRVAFARRGVSGGSATAGLLVWLASAGSRADAAALPRSLWAGNLAPHALSAAGAGSSWLPSALPGVASAALWFAVSASAGGMLAFLPGVAATPARMAVSAAAALPLEPPPADAANPSAPPLPALTGLSFQEVVSRIQAIAGTRLDHLSELER